VASASKDLIMIGSVVDCASEKLGEPAKRPASRTIARTQGFSGFIIDSAI
jgi:hypothetical protein